VEGVLRGCGAALLWVSHDPAQPARVGGRGLHSYTIQLNVSTFCGICWVHDFPPVY